MPTYKGTKYINQALTTKGFDEQIRKLEGFDKLFVAVMTPAVARAVEIARARAVENAPRGETGGLAGSIQGRILSPTKNAVRGSISAGSGQPELKAFAQEVGRFYGSKRGNRHFRKGSFYLYFGVRDRIGEIESILGAGNETIVKALAVK